MTARLSHLNDKGEARMVDVSTKDVTTRTARAEGFVAMSPGTLELILSGKAPKGDVLATARVAGIMAAKRTHELIPLCHPLAITASEIAIMPMPDGFLIRATIETTGPTGVEMEALTAASVAALTIYDMGKALDRAMTIGDIQVEQKSGGRSGTFSRLA